MDSAAWSLNPDHGGIYLKDPVVEGALDSYLDKVSRAKNEQIGQRTLL